MATEDDCWKLALMAQERRNQAAAEAVEDPGSESDTKQVAKAASFDGMKDTGFRPSSRGNMNW